jgi:hypothetical protein
VELLADYEVGNVPIRVVHEQIECINPAQDRENVGAIKRSRDGALMPVLNASSLPPRTEPDAIRERDFSGDWCRQPNYFTQPTTEVFVVSRKAHAIWVEPIYFVLLDGPVIAIQATTNQLEIIRLDAGRAAERDPNLEQIKLVRVTPIAPQCH